MKEKEKENFQSKEKRKKGNCETKRGRKKKRRRKGRKSPIKENKRNMQKGLWTGQYLNNTELSPNEQKEGKETTT